MVITEFSALLYCMKVLNDNFVFIIIRALTPAMSTAKLLIPAVETQEVMLIFQTQLQAGADIPIWFSTDCESGAIVK